MLNFYIIPISFFITTYFLTPEVSIFVQSTQRHVNEPLFIQSFKEKLYKDYQIYIQNTRNGPYTSTDIECGKFIIENAISFTISLLFPHKKSNLSATSSIKDIIYRHVKKFRNGSTDFDIVNSIEFFEACRDLQTAVVRNYFEQKTMAFFIFDNV